MGILYVCLILRGEPPECREILRKEIHYIQCVGTMAEINRSRQDQIAWCVDNGKSRD